MQFDDLIVLQSSMVPLELFLSCVNHYLNIIVSSKLFFSEHLIN